MSQLDADQYLRLTAQEPVYGQSDGLYKSVSTGDIVLVRGDTIVATWTSSGQSLSGAITADANGVTTLGSAVVGASNLTANLAIGFIPLDIGSLRIIAANVIGNTTEGMMLDGNTAPSLQRVNSATDKQLRAIWAAGSAVEVQFGTFAYPPDLDDTASLTVNIIAAMAGSTDTPVMTVAYFEGLGDTDAGGATAAITGTSLARYSRTIAASDIGAFPNVATVGLTPGSHGSDALHLYAAWIQYARKS